MQAAFLPASSGWQWVRDGQRLFMKQPLAVFTWALAIRLLMLFATLTSPVGPLLFIALIPAVTLMTLSACKHIDAGRLMLPSMWPQPLTRPGVFQKMLTLGVSYAALCIAAGLVSFTLCIAAGLVSFMPFADTLVESIRISSIEKDLAPIIDAMWMPLALFGILYVIIAALFWHAPVLVAWHGLRIGQALFFSGIACWRNKWPFLVYGTAWVLVFLFIDLCTGLLVQAGVPPELAGTLKIPFNIAAVGVLYCSFYPAYTSVFGIEDTHAHLDGGSNDQTRSQA